MPDAFPQHIPAADTRTGRPGRGDAVSGRDHMMDSARNPRVTAFGPEAGWDVAVVIPAKDEQDRIESCLDALGKAALQVPDCRTAIVVVVNNTTDATAATVQGWATRSRADVSVLLVDHHFDAETSGVGHARRLGLDLACAAMRGNGVLLATDADTHVTPAWIAANMAELHEADVICGKVDAIAAEQAALPVEISRHGSAEAEYVAAALELAALLDPRPHDPHPAHHNAAGASLGFTRSVLAAVGGMPTLSIGEDRAFVERAEALDYRVRYSDRPVVRTSCRMVGRTSGGMAGALRDRRDLPDPPCDEWLEPARTFHLRHALRGALRQVWPVGARVADVLVRHLGAEHALRCAADTQYFGQFFQMIEAGSAQLRRVRLCQSDCRRELPALQRLLADVRKDRLLAVRPFRHIRSSALAGQ